MSKYIDADKLIAEIERLKDKYPSWQLKLAMDDLCDFITYLQQEQPEEKLKNDDIGKYVREHFYYNKELYGYSHSKDLSVFTTDDIINLARHFYELGRERKEE